VAGGGCHADRCAEFDQERSGERDPEMKQSRKGQQWYFGMKCHIGVDLESGLVHTVRGTSGAVNDVTEANSLVRRATARSTPTPAIEAPTRGRTPGPV
jgi:IS5 family transposase